MAEDTKHGYRGKCHLCGRPCGDNMTCPHCGAVNTPMPAPLKGLAPGSDPILECFNCGRRMDPMNWRCNYCGAVNSPNPITSQGDKAMTYRWDNHSLQGCLFEDAPTTAPTLTAPQGSVPDHVDLRALCSPVEDQLTTNSCTANAIVGALEYHQRKVGMQKIDMSRLFVYYNARKISDTESQDTGSFIHHVMASVLAHGACEARMWPFEKAMVLTEPTKAAYSNAMNYEAIQYARTALGNNTMAAVAAGLPVVFGTYIPGDYYKEAAQTGIMPVDKKRAQRRGGGHAMLIVGYDIPGKTWLIRNSWGADWADGGYFRIPFETMQSYSDPSHFWTIGAIEQTQGVALAGPSMSQMQENVKTQAPAEAQAALSAMRGSLRGDLKANLDTAKEGFRSRLRGK